MPNQEGILGQWSSVLPLTCSPISRKHVSNANSMLHAQSPIESLLGRCGWWPTFTLSAHNYLTQHGIKSESSRVLNGHCMLVSVSMLFYDSINTGTQPWQEVPTFISPAIFSGSIISAYASPLIVYTKWPILIRMAHSMPPECSTGHCYAHAWVLLSARHLSKMKMLLNFWVDPSTWCTHNCHKDLTRLSSWTHVTSLPPLYTSVMCGILEIHSTLVVHMYTNKTYVFGQVMWSSKSAHSATNSQLCLVLHFLTGNSCLCLTPVILLERTNMGQLVCA